MGNDPRSSVVDKSCRVHDVDNVFVIDSSVHVNNGGFNPGLTIMAIAFYASEALVRGWKGGATGDDALDSVWAYCLRCGDGVGGGGRVLCVRILLVRARTGLRELPRDGGGGVFGS